ncbi:hypothetical protein MYX84_15490, partial [Acidobacteria bacterium AH-259-O06]|nr:hypothetical protein [Acidobacteria bacterium AH-259-O06]
MSRKVTIVCFLLVAVLVGACATQPTVKHLMLVDEGKSTYSIVVSPSAPAPERFAAEELQRYFLEIASVQLPIIDTHSGASIQVGFDPESPRYRPLRDLNEDSFLIQAENQNLYLAGNSPRGTLYAVYYFLEKYL